IRFVRVAIAGATADGSRNVLMLNPQLGLSFADLYSIAGLARIDAEFKAHLADADRDLRTRFDAARTDPAALGRLGESELLVALAPHVEDFLARLFAIETSDATRQAQQHELPPQFACKPQVF